METIPTHRDYQLAADDRLGVSAPERIAGRSAWVRRRLAGNQYLTGHLQPVLAAGPWQGRGWTA